MMKNIKAFALLVAAAALIHFLTYSPLVKMALVCDQNEKCIDLYGKLSVAISMGAISFWGIGRADDPSGHCRKGCTVKTIYDQVGEHHLTQTDSTKRPAYPMVTTKLIER